MLFYVFFFLEILIVNGAWRKAHQCPSFQQHSGCGNRDNCGCGNSMLPNSISFIGAEIIGNECCYHYKSIRHTDRQDCRGSNNFQKSVLFPIDCKKEYFDVTVTDDVEYHKGRPTCIQGIRYHRSCKNGPCPITICVKYNTTVMATGKCGAVKGYYSVATRYSFIQGTDLYLPSCNEFPTGVMIAGGGGGGGGTGTTNNDPQCTSMQCDWATSSGDPHFHTWDCGRHNFQGGKTGLFYLIKPCINVNRQLSKFPFRLVAKFRDSDNFEKRTTTDYHTLKLFGEDGKVYFVYFSVSIFGWIEGTSNNTFYDYDLTNAQHTINTLSLTTSATYRIGPVTSGLKIQFERKLRSKCKSYENWWYLKLDSNPYCGSATTILKVVMHGRGSTVPRIRIHTSRFWLDLCFKRWACGILGSCRGTFERCDNGVEFTVDEKYDSKLGSGWHSWHCEVNETENITTTTTTDTPSPPPPCMQPGVLTTVGEKCKEAVFPKWHTCCEEFTDDNCTSVIQDCREDTCFELNSTNITAIKNLTQTIVDEEERFAVCPTGGEDPPVETPPPGATTTAPPITTPCIKDCNTQDPKHYGNIKKLAIEGLKGEFYPFNYAQYTVVRGYTAVRCDAYSPTHQGNMSWNDGRDLCARVSSSKLASVHNLDEQRALLAAMLYKGCESAWIGAKEATGTAYSNYKWEDGTTPTTGDYQGWDFSKTGEPNSATNKGYVRIKFVNKDCQYFYWGAEGNRQHPCAVCVKEYPDIPESKIKKSWTYVYARRFRNNPREFLYKQFTNHSPIAVVSLIVVNIFLVLLICLAIRCCQKKQKLFENYERIDIVSSSDEEDVDDVLIKSVSNEQKKVQINI